MFELYKKRQLGDNLGDTVLFFKNFGKNFFKIFFIINGAFLVLFSILVYFLMKINFESIKSSGLENNQLKSDLLNYFNNNEGLAVFIVVIFVLILLLLSMFNYSFPVLYLKMIKNGKTDLELNDALNDFRKNFFKLIKFTIGFLFIIFPVLVITLIIMFFLCFIIIGIPLLIIALPACFNFLNLSFYSYLTEEKRFFESLRHAYYLIKEDFWNTIGTTLIVMIIIQFIQAGVTMFLYFGAIFIFMASVLAGSDLNNPTIEPSPLLLLFITAVVVLITLLGNIFSNIILINQGMIYYSLESGNKPESKSIDLIGDHNNE